MIDGNCFNEFDDVSPKRKDPSIQVLYDYEKHYMELVKKYGPEIALINGMLKDYRMEQIHFYEETLPEIEKKMEHDVGVDAEMKKVWLNRLTSNIDRSFSLTETLITGYVTKSMDEFHIAVNEKLRKL